MPMSQNPPAILSVRNVSKTFRSGPAPVAALREVGLEVRVGQFVAIMGPSGSGKSTLLNLIGGLEQVDSGEIVIDGQDISRLSDYQLSLFRRRKIGFIFQQLNLLPTLSARENVALPQLIDGRSMAEVEEGVRRCLELVGLSERAGHRPDALSGGEQQRVAIARCLLTAPALILADEPTGNLDTENGSRVLSVLRSLTRGTGGPTPGAGSPAGATGTGATGTGATGTGATGNGTPHTVIMVTHEARAAAHTDAIFFLRDGRVVGHERLDGTQDAAFVADCYQRHEGAARP
jgi:putative ABC transport system ATP-binding protein